MKKILLLFTIIALVWSCDKDDDELTYEEVVQRLEIEKAKVNQDSLIAIIEGDWYGMKGPPPMHLIFSSDPNNFKDIRSESTEWEELHYDVNGYFFIKVDPDPNVYRLISYHNRYGGNNPDLYAFLKITREAIFYISASTPSEIKNNLNLAYKCIMDKSSFSFDEGNDPKFQRTKQGL